MRKKRTFAVLLLTFLLFLFMNSPLLGKWMYPVKYQKEIGTYAAQYQVDPYLVASIIRVETNYRSGKTSRVGAIGLMQIMPDTAYWIFERREFSNLTLNHLENSEENIKIGTWYLHWLSEQFQGNWVAVIAAYNAGPGNVAKWLQQKQWDGTLEGAGNIPFGETRHYVQRVAYFYKKYKEVYREGLD